MSGTPANLARLVALVDARGDVRGAVREYCGLSLAALARQTGLGRKDVDMCLGASYGRSYLGVRRALEVELDLPQYGLDIILDKED